MKKYSKYLVFALPLLLNCLLSKGQINMPETHYYYSKNPITSPGTTFEDIPKLHYDSLFKFNPPIQINGIIGNVNSGGYIKLVVYGYDDTKPNGIGELAYEKVLTESSTNYAGERRKIHKELKGNEYSMWSDDTKSLSQWVAIYNGSDYFACNQIKEKVKSAYNVALVYDSKDSSWFKNGIPAQCKKYFTPQQPVVIQVIIHNATLNKIKIPGMGEPDVNKLFMAQKPLMPVNGKVMLGCHRGVWQGVNEPENTKSSIQKMIDEGYDMLELDLWSTSDDSLIVFHDMGLNKRTSDTGGIKTRTWNSLQDLYIKNRFEELITSPTTKISRLSEILDYMKLNDPQGKIKLNLDRSANDINFFKKVYLQVNNKGMLDRTIFKGRYNPGRSAPGEISPTPSSIEAALVSLFPSETPEMIQERMLDMYFTPILFDNSYSDSTRNDMDFAVRVKAYIDDMISSGIASGFEMNFKSYPVGSSQFANDNNDNVFLLRQWIVLHPLNLNFIDYVQSKGFPVGIFASVPEVCAIQDFNPDGTRSSVLVSGFIKENTSTFIPKVTDQGFYDFRGDWDFYIGAGVNYVITDRPDALRVYLKAIGKLYQ